MPGVKVDRVSVSALCTLFVGIAGQGQKQLVAISNDTEITK
jgi:hypothetical protein